MKTTTLALPFLVIAIATVSLAREDEASPLERRAREVADLIRPDASGFERLFSKEFLAQVPPERLAAIAAQYHAIGGRCTRVELVKAEGPHQGKFSFFFEKGYKVAVTLVVAGDAPHHVTGLLFANPVRLVRTIGAIVAELDELPGKVSLELSRLDPARGAPLAGLEPGRPLAIGSSFKLWVLAELVRQVESGKRRLEETVPLKSESLSLPSGMLHSWPAGSPLTLHTLASLMISISDNTATDQLIATLGRENIEACLVETGHGHAAKNVPFLTTLDMFRLKGDPAGRAARRFLGLEAGGRRAFLANELPAIARDKIQFGNSGKPSLIDEIEWFASARDLCEVMDWLRRHTERGAAAPLREVLAINPGLGLDKRTWSYVGFKGGSEPGVLNLTFLLRSRGGDWHAVSAGWNDPSAAVDEARLTGLVQRLIELVPLRY